MTLTPALSIHLSAALAATALGPIALWARRSGAQRPRLHRAVGYAWITLMVTTALSAAFITGTHGPRIAGYGPIHLLIPFTLGAIGLGLRALLRGRIQAHRKTMLGLYLGACVGAGAFTLLPQRFLGQWVWGQWLGLL